MEEDYDMEELGDLRDSLTVLFREEKKIKVKKEKKKKEELLSVIFSIL